jgi:hypothetical protein
MAAGEALAFLSIIGFFISYEVCQLPCLDCPPPLMEAHADGDSPLLFRL